MAEALTSLDGTIIPCISIYHSAVFYEKFMTLYRYFNIGPGFKVNYTSNNQFVTSYKGKKEIKSHTKKTLSVVEVVMVVHHQRSQIKNVSIIMFVHQCFVLSHLALKFLKQWTNTKNTYYLEIILFPTKDLPWIMHGLLLCIK